MFNKCWQIFVNWIKSFKSLNNTEEERRNELTNEIMVYEIKTDKTDEITKDEVQVETKDEVQVETNEVKDEIQMEEPSLNYK